MVNHNYFTERDVERLEDVAVRIRLDIISMIHTAKAGHPGGSLSAVEMVTALYFHVMNIDPENPAWADRDRFILSKGHSCPVLKAARETGAIMTIEDHTIFGGLGSAVAEVVVEHNPVPMQRIGIQDRFGESGEPEELYRDHGMDVETIVEKAKKLIARKKDRQLFL